MILHTIYLLAISTVTIAATTGTGTGGCKPVTWSDEKHTAPTRSVHAEPEPAQTSASSNRLGDAKTGEINCRYDGATHEKSGIEACEYLTSFYDVTMKKFLMLNPMLEGDCGSVKQNTIYCVAGFVEPLRAFDGKCGPRHKNATCIGTDLGQCCNSQTWKCGRKVADCEPGNCYDGVCWGHKIYTTDGTCGYQNGNRFCAGKWGNCCNLEGVCGSGEEFCGVKTGQSCTRLRGIPWEWGWKLWTD